LLLSSTYKSNSRLLININNSPKKSVSTLKVNDIIPSELLQFGVFSVEHTADSLKCYIGSSALTKTVSFYELKIDNLKGASKFVIQVYINTKNKNARMIAYIDDLRTFFDIKTTYPIEPISVSSYVYNHPAVSSFKINVRNPRFIRDFYKYFSGKAQDISTYASKLCGKGNCVKCSYVPNKSIICDRCDKGFKLVNNICLKANLDA